MQTIESNVIIGAALGYNNETLHNFIMSLVNIRFDGKLVLLVEKGRGPLPETALDVTRVEIDQSLTKDDGRSPSTRRYFWIKEFLERYPCRGRVMLSDVRDVVFQSDPFQSQHVLEADLLFALEEKTIGACGWNSDWICKMYGAAIFDGIAGYTISCSGTTIGKYDNVLAYVTKMCRHLLLAPDIFGLDQGIHNYIIYRDYVAGQKLGLNGLSYVATMQYMHKIETVGGVVLNYDGSKVPVLHQYDRLSGDRQREIAAVSVPTR